MSSIDQDLKLCDKTVSSLVQFTFAEERLLRAKGSGGPTNAIRKRTDIVCELTHDHSYGQSYRSLLQSAVRERNKHSYTAKPIGIDKIK